MVRYLRALAFACVSLAGWGIATQVGLDGGMEFVARNDPLFIDVRCPSVVQSTSLTLVSRYPLTILQARQRQHSESDTGLMPRITNPVDQFSVRCIEVQ